MLAFVEGAGLRAFRHPERDRPESPQAAAEALQRLIRIEQNLDYFFAHIIGPAAAYVPDTAALRSVPVTVAVGDASEGQMAHATALALAGRLGVEPETLPGGHSGFVTHPVGFARRLREILTRN